MQKAIFLDRDGVINSDIGHYYIYQIKDFVINEGIISSLKKFSDNGYLLFIVTNQGGIAKGIYTKKDVHILHQHLLEILNKESIRIEKIYMCPHHDSIAPCKCRKPSPFFIQQALNDFHINKDLSYMIGDSERDIESAKAAGIKGIKINPNENISSYCDKIIKGEI
ncbi:D-glycero-alpha-D-manno-heptose-1,7-bisphosphate 7-phosphatase [Ancylomarina longa]|uniref:D,D-heptose 1,7-bisphosphate phosphatase n=1 Tax=Ancylomarina longa TaxID=2487017 RepID=A0A434AFU8_9BACT|nr:HAD family hydrolase [Ancylomarina longa]RUT73244.1 HAD family hydrolase [Ancylomarina longa]